MRNFQKIFIFLLILVFFITTILYFFKFQGIEKMYTTRYKQEFLHLDSRSAPNETIIFQHISKEMPYLPIEDLNNDSFNYRNFNQSCAWYPSLKDIQIHNDYWQEFHYTNITYFIYGAYLDKRSTVVGDQPMVRLLTMMHFITRRDEDYPKVYCQLWYEEQKEPVIVPANEQHRLWYYDWGHGPEHNYGHMLSCALPMEHRDRIPRTVSLVESSCDKATNNVRVTYFPLNGQEVKQEFAVCVKGLDYPYVDMSYRLVEYIEAIRALGADKIIMYNLQTHKNITKVLEYYQETGYLEVLPLSTSSKRGNLPEYRHMDMTKNYFPYILHEVIPYNDCIYRNMYRYNYVAVIDIDEIPMPMGNFSSWHDLIELGENLSDTKCKKFASYCLRCTYFPGFPEKPQHTNSISEQFYMLRHVERVRQHVRPDWFTKCFHNTNHIIATHNHFPFYVTRDVCKDYSFNASDAQLQHYREPSIEMDLNDTIIDTSLWRFKDQIIERSMEVFKELQFLKEISSED